MVGIWSCPAALLQLDICGSEESSGNGLLVQAQWKSTYCMIPGLISGSCLKAEKLWWAGLKNPRPVIVVDTELYVLTQPQSDTWHHITILQSVNQINNLIVRKFLRHGKQVLWSYIFTIHTGTFMHFPPPHFGIIQRVSYPGNEYRLVPVDQEMKLCFSQTIFFGMCGNLSLCQKKYLKVRSTFC